MGRSSYLGLVVVLHGHGDDVDADDEGDEEVEVVAGAQAVDVSPGRGVVGIVGSALGFCGDTGTAVSPGGCRDEGHQHRACRSPPTWTW